MPNAVHSFSKSAGFQLPSRQSKQGNMSSPRARSSHRNTSAPQERELFFLISKPGEMFCSESS